MKTQNREPNSHDRKVPLDITDFRSLDEYFDYCGLCQDERVAYRNAVLFWLKSYNNDAKIKQ